MGRTAGLPAGSDDEHPSVQRAERHAAGWLSEQGANVLMTREDDRDLAEEDSENRKRDDMKKRVEFIECGFCDMFVSIHLNAYPDSSVRGAQVFYQPDSMQSERMAQLMQEELSSCSGQQRKQKPGDYYILTRTTVPGILAECGFLSNPVDEANLLDPDYRAEFAYSVFRAAAAFLSDGA